MNGIITIDSNGRIEQIAGHGPDLSGEGQAETRRASWVVPVNVFLRAAFHACRWFGDDTALAGWTRRWRCLWKVQIIDGPVLPGAWRDRSEAIAAEVAWLERNRLA
jgi:hypothetical protein